MAKARKSKPIYIHGNLVNIFGIGVLLLGKSGIGKSECCLDLITRGHQLVADDITKIEKLDAKTLRGHPSEILRHHMEVRGLGIVDIKEIFGLAGICPGKNINLVVELLEWNPTSEYNRSGSRKTYYTLLDVTLPLLKIPVSPARNPATIIEVAAKNELLKREGTHTESNFQKMILREIKKKGKKTART